MQEVHPSAVHVHPDQHVVLMQVSGSLSAAGPGMRLPSADASQSAAALQGPATPAPGRGRGRGRGRSAAATSRGGHKSANGAGPRHQQHSIIDMFGRSGEGPSCEQDPSGCRRSTAGPAEPVIDVTSSPEQPQPSRFSRPAVSHAPDRDQGSPCLDGSQGTQHHQMRHACPTSLRAHGDRSTPVEEEVLPVSTPMHGQHAQSSPGKRKAAPDAGNNEDDDIVVLLDTPSPAGAAQEPCKMRSTGRGGRGSSALGLQPQLLPEGLLQRGSSPCRLSRTSLQAQGDVQPETMSVHQHGQHAQQAPGPPQSPSKR